MKFCHREHGAPTQRTQSQSKSVCLSLRDLCVRAPARLRAKNSVLLVLAVALLPACRREARNENPDTPPTSAPSASIVPAPTTASTTDHTEVFRRAFWRQPTSADQILQAERRVNPEDGSWQWFIQLHPSPELLAALRDPENLGLLPLGAPVFNRHPIPPPVWFPDQATLASPGFEILRSPATALTVLYRAADNTLFATDHGPAFAPPVR